jgi:hypothetical protein
MSYWKAHPHQWGKGLTHVIHEDGDRTLCGKKFRDCPGQHIPENEYDCRACAKVMDTREQQRKREERWKQESARRQQEREQEIRERRLQYSAYRRGPDWAWRRKAVFKRADGLCESCGRQRATEVHHKTYDHIFDEPLFDLAAICRECHEKITKRDRERRLPWWMASEAS